MMRRNFIASIVGGSLVIFLLAGGMSAPALHAAGDTLRQGVPSLPPATRVAGSGGSGATSVPAAAPPPAPTYQYRAAGKSDPFKPFLETDPVLKKKMEEEQKKKVTAVGRPVSPLQQADIAQFRLVGIAGDQNRRTAIVEDGAAKKYYPLFVGTYIGLNGGRVAAILPDRLVIEERVGTPDKKTKKVQVRQIQVLLHKEQ